MAVGDNVKFKIGTQDQYDSASSIDEDALYFTTDTKHLYKGSTLYNKNYSAYTIVIGNKPAGDTEKDCNYLYQEEYASSFFAMVNSIISSATSPVTLFFRRGTYNIYDTLYVGAGKNVTIIGENRDGTILNEYYYDSITHTSRNLIQVGQYDSYGYSGGTFNLKDITLKTSSSSAYTKGYAIQCCGDLTVNHCRITGSGQNTHGIYTEGQLTVQDSEISSCNYGVMARNCSRYNISSNKLESCVCSIVTGMGGYDNIPGTTDYQGNYLDGAGRSTQSAGCFGHICNNYISSPTSTGIYVGSRSTVSGNIVYNSEGTGLQIDSGYCNVTGNTVKVDYNLPLYVYRLGGNESNFSNNLFFVSNHYYSVSYYPLYCTASYCTITGNTLPGDHYGQSDYDYGAYFSDTATNNIITSNRMRLIGTISSSNIQANNSTNW